MAFTGARGTFGKRALDAPVRATAQPAPQAAPLPQVLPGFGARIAARIPWFTLALSGVLAARFVVELRSATDYVAPYAPGHFTLLAAGASSRDQVLGHGEWWRLFTATVLHGSPEHLIGNIVTFLIVGFLLEPMIGIGWFSAIYFTGAFAGAVMSMLLNDAGTLAVGASGAIMATLAALFTLSFHAGAARPRLMRRVAGGSLFPALIPTVAQGGAITDVNAHFGGCLAGACIAFAMLIAWNDETDTPPGRSIAAIIAGLWLAITTFAFASAGHSYATYAKPGLDYIPPAELPKDDNALKAGSLSLVDKYPKDPRAHLFRGLYLLEQQDAAGAEPYFRSAIRLDQTSQILSREFHDWDLALLALAVRVQHRNDEARGLAAPLCADQGALDQRTLKTLELTKLCN
ncbi:MAG TPA: rhomboid family intramembrane serine protease [Rhizomicrobium sp.]|nr:rhomboid family intramembrane serine protease [Rhizomicrobium sp.]